ncbi:hypothetical protein ACFU7Y_37305, partial [Kitasatospora sp. NPDC057542]|uniref:hypothetical protein n=1 Tax=Kitasatospora sp. NPDC057542 TaxID=3346162 RepID=UPI003678694C
EDGMRLLRAVLGPGTPVRLRALPQVEVLRQVSPGTVRVLIHQAHSKLRKLTLLAVSESDEE